MERISTLNKSFTGKKQDEIADSNERKLSFNRTRTNAIFDNLVAEDCVTFFYYLDSLGLAKDRNIMILSSIHHYYYDVNDLKCVNTLINLKKLNHIKHLNSFLHTLFRLLPPDADFVGYFKENKNSDSIDTHFNPSSRLINGIINFLDSRTDRSLSKNEVSKMLASYGFRVLDMTEIHGLIYFRAKNTRNSVI
jgi:hypothetical protein